jgi:hypothetical protein
MARMRVLPISEAEAIGRFRELGAPEGIDSYNLKEATSAGSLLPIVRFGDSTMVLLDKTLATRYGTFRCGWNAQARVAAYAMVRE